jgi:hypothetical protein
MLTLTYSDPTHPKKKKKQRSFDARRFEDYKLEEKKRKFLYNVKI